MNNFLHIKSDKDLNSYIQKLHEETIRIIAVDFEGEYNLHQYGETLCLIQIYDGKRFVIIDPFCIKSDGIKSMLEDYKITKIFFDAGTDKTLVFKQYGIKINSILDLMDMVKLLELEKKGLDSVLASMLNITVTKKKKFQRHNWTRRPIVDEALQYALSDVKYLFPLKDILLKKIIDANLYEQLLIGEINNNREIKLSTVPGVKKKKPYKLLSPRMRDKFDSIFLIREKYAEKMNLPPNSVISNENLFNLARSDRNCDSSIIHHSIPRSIKTEILNKINA